MLKQAARRIFDETLGAVDVRLAMQRKLALEGTQFEIAVANVLSGPPSPPSHSHKPIQDMRIDLRNYREIVAIAFGKAAFAMAEGLTEILAPEFQVEGILVVPARPPRAIEGWEVIVAGHPLPDEKSFRAGRMVLNRLWRCGKDSLIFFLVSGGGSALVEERLDPTMSVADFRALNQSLVTCGAPIEDINVIRKHLSGVKGGRLAVAAPESLKITLGVSDVPDGHETALASGPTLPDPSTIADAERVAQEFDLLPKIPPAVREIFEKHALMETPKPGDEAFRRVHFSIILGSHDLIHHAHINAEAAGFTSLCDNSTDDWPLETAADHLLRQLLDLKQTNPNCSVAVISGGELRSPVRGDGVGGRNSAFVLTCAAKIAGEKFGSSEIAVLSAGTDGIDGNSPAAGAVADRETLRQAKDAGLDPEDFLARSDSHRFFQRLGDAIITGPTGNNLRDLRILMMR